MRHHSSEALTLRTYVYAESHKIAVFLTRDLGQLRAVAHGARKGQSRFGSTLEPLTHVRLVFSRKEHHDLAVIERSEMIAPPPPPSSWEASLYLAYFAELLWEFSNELQESERVFRLALAVLEAVPSAPLEQVARYLELWLLRLEGVLPDLESRLTGPLVRRVETLMRRHPRELASVRLEEREVKRLGSVCGELIEYHLEKRLKSARMIRELKVGDPEAGSPL